MDAKDHLLGLAEALAYPAVRIFMCCSFAQIWYGLLTKLIAIVL